MNQFKIYSTGNEWAGDVGVLSASRVGISTLSFRAFVSKSVLVLVTD